MFNVNQVLVVKPTHKYHPGRTGYFQFMGGSNKNSVVLSVAPVKETDNYRQYFAVSIEDIL